ncbi:MAG: aromatic ring-hydroxylating dioxygenase subunit alpha [Pseudomonadota bacterium]|nr:aromatic ring-hydroxylating dioxygenase subunit alpha [Pseudomonadota bacterium]
MSNRSSTNKNKTQHFANQVPRPWVQDIYPHDQHSAPAGLLNSACDDLATEDVSVERYFSYEWHRREVEHVWKKTWQVACRIEEIPEVGDYVVYDIVDDSVIVVRTAGAEVVAFTNSCLHRATTLAEGAGNCSEFRCPYHGWTYALSGELEFVPGAWDFSHLDLKNTQLPRVRIDQWAGFVFINLDPECAPLHDYLGVLPEHLDAFNIDKRYKAVHVSKIVPCNWKVAQEAFIEGYHVAQTHYDKNSDGSLAATGAAVSNYDTSIQYDYWPPHVTRMNMLGGIASGYIADQVLDDQTIVDAYFRLNAGDSIKLEPGQTARSVIAQHNRKIWGERHRVDLSAHSDAEMIDQIQYTLFPNFTIWPTIVAPLCYRFRPEGDDPTRSVFEIWMLYPIADDGTHPATMDDLRLDDDQAWAEVRELSGYGPVIDQDTPNFPRIQKGLQASAKRAVSLANYQESRIRAFHETLDTYLAGEMTSD